MLNNGQKTRLRLDSNERGIALQDYLDRHKDWFRHLNLAEAIANGQFQAEGKALERHQLLPAEVFFFRPPWQEPPAPAVLLILFQDADLVVVEKPAGVPMTPCGDFLEHSLLHLLRKQRDSETLSPVHRLDLETSGVCMFAKSTRGRKHYQTQFQQRLVHKYYHALVWGQLDPDLKLIEDPLVRHSEIYTRFVPGAGGVSARTELLSVEAQGCYSRVIAKPITGRTNQIRAHLAGIGHAIVGDKKYHPDPNIFLTWLKQKSRVGLEEALPLAHQALHCAKMTLPHLDGSQLTLTSSADAFAAWG